MPFPFSMVEHKFLGVQQGPKGIGQDLGGVGVGSEKGVEFLEFDSAGLAGEAAEVEVLKDLLAGLAGFEEFFNDGALVDFVLQGIAIEQVKRLGEVRVDFDFARTNGGAAGPAEGGEEIIGGVAVQIADGNTANY